MPKAWSNSARSASTGTKDTNIDARDATKGRRAHQTCSRFGARNGAQGVRSRVLSMPILAMGNQRSTRRHPLGNAQGHLKEVKKRL